VKLIAVIVACAALGACASSGAVPRPRPFPGASLPPTASAPEKAGEGTPVVVATALSYRGVPYRNGGSDPSGFDCSGFVQWVFAQHGISLPRATQEQYRTGAKIGRDEVRPGDLVFFETVSHGASHVGIALGGDEFVHAPSSRGVVRIERYTSEYWRKRYVGARRVAATDTNTH
jgi:cell wall-associated NlpC family hydrolase